VRRPDTSILGTEGIARKRNAIHVNPIQETTDPFVLLTNLPSFFYVKIDCGMGKPSGQSTSLVFFIIFQYSRFLFYMIDYILLFISNLAAEDAISELRCHEKGPWGGGGGEEFASNQHRLLQP